MRGKFLYPERGQKQTFFDRLPPNLVHIVIECPPRLAERFRIRDLESVKLYGEDLMPHTLETFLASTKHVSEMI